ncbi:oligopeptide transport system ATP-binding protein [Streptomyces sp. TverLS-915]|uniref:ABC transporter ATP-binding protein n=1 Tax=Streptomyces sp. TverLS-915 TaxID=1839763 RepID=UPI00081D8CA2|nr:ABC transporter ATP-binding protein [Streptomyces sp. TverLS-915]SCD66226.1 oligopeptide transport system ATP-binding protein [Streptomyces sp. TverLS-915]
MNNNPRQHPLLHVENLGIEFRSGDRRLPAVQNLSFSIERGRTLAVLGESGCGKSVTAKAIMGILPTPPARVTGGRVLLDGVDLLALAPKAFRKVRGADVAMVFQDALSALNPVVPVVRQIAEVYRIHRGASRRDAETAAVDMMRAVKIPDAANRARHYPFQFSGGMRQRIMIAMALALEPRLLIADEPTTALDVTVQAQILDLLAELQRERDMSLMLITHDLGVAAHIAEEALVMYAGGAVEQAPIAELLDRPAHPYTIGLLGSIPGPEHRGADLPTIPGLPPQLDNRPTGCGFHPRCRFATDLCRREAPPAHRVSAGRTAACHHWKEAMDDYQVAGA